MFRPAAVVAVVALMGAVSGCALGIAHTPVNVTGAGATIDGTVFSTKAGTTRYWFEYGTTTSYGSKTPEGSLSIADDDGHPVSVTLRGLNPNTTYHVLMCVQDGEDPPRPLCSPDQKFRTLNEDSLTGRLTQPICDSPPPPACGTITNVFEAYTGPLGESPHGGSLIVLRGGEPPPTTETHQWDLTCLNVQGNRATIAMKVRDPATWSGPADYARVWITDTNGTGKDLTLYENRDTPTNSCPIEPPSAPQPVTGTGDYFVRDAQP